LGFRLEFLTSGNSEFQKDRYDDKMISKFVCRHNDFDHRFRFQKCRDQSLRRENIIEENDLNEVVDQEDSHFDVNMCCFYVRFIRLDVNDKNSRYVLCDYNMSHTHPLII
jgi:hypothetical protein